MNNPEMEEVINDLAITAFNMGIEAAAKTHDIMALAYEGVGDISSSESHKQWALNIRSFKKEKD